jgi:hypothetical protein
VLAAKLARYGLNTGGDRAASYTDCVNWINSNC